MKPYIARFISPGSGMGKTSVVSYIASWLLARGYKVAVVKHAAHGVSLEDKDSHVYVERGVPEVVVSSGNLGIIYLSRWVDSLETVLARITSPVVLVEGFKEADVGDVIVIGRTCSDLLEMEKYKPVARVVWGDKCRELGNVYSINRLEELAAFIEERAVNHILGQLPGLNCGYCGYNTCRELAVAYLKNMTNTCPVSSRVKLYVNDAEVAMNPFVKKMLVELVNGFLNGLKGIPVDRRKIRIEIDLTE